MHVSSIQEHQAFEGIYGLEVLRLKPSFLTPSSAHSLEAEKEKINISLNIKEAFIQ